MKVSLFGSGDISKIQRFSKLSEEEVKKLIEDVGKLLAEKKVELVIVPSRGISYDVAKVYKEHKGPKIIGAIPKDDKDYGIKHIEEYRHISDKEINIGDWYDLNGRLAAQGDLSICIGLSGGGICNIAMLKYHYKYLGSKTKLIIFENTISSKLHAELEEDLKGNLTYINSIKQLKKLLESFS